MDINLFKEQTALSVLRPSTISRLSDLMNKNGVVNKKSKKYNNYIGLAELAGFRKEQIDCLNKSDDPTGTLLDEWSKMAALKGKTSSVPTISDLWTFLSTLGRDDVIRELTTHVCDDIKSVTEELTYEEKEMDGLCMDRNGKKLYFDAFVAYNEDEEARITPVVLLLEAEGNLKLFYLPRDMPAGVTYYPTQAYIIEKRCRKLLCLITKGFISSPSCEFLVRFVHHLAPDGSKGSIVPLIMDKNSQLPSILTSIVKINFSSDSDVAKYPKQIGWNRLLDSIKRPTRSQSMMSERSIGNSNGSNSNSTSLYDHSASPQSQDGTVSSSREMQCLNVDQHGAQGNRATAICEEPALGGTQPVCHHTSDNTHSDNNDQLPCKDKRKTSRTKHNGIIMKIRKFFRKKNRNNNSIS